MARVLPDTAEELRSELSNLIVRRLRIGLRAFLAGVVLFVVADHSLMTDTPRWADGLNAVLIALAAIFLALSGRPTFRAHAVPFGLLIVAMICGSRALAGIWTGDLVPTAIVCLVVALTAGAFLPWGAWPQLASVAIAGLAIASNAYLMSGTSTHATAQLIAAVFTALMVSAVLSFELQRNHSRLVEENIRRRRAEDDLARLNAELESRVNARTAELTAATQRLEREALERKHAEEQVRQHQAHLAHVLRLNTMGEMAAGLAHEINQPLGAIANYAQGCTRRLRGGSVDGAELLPIVEEIAHEALRAGEIIRRLRDLVRKEGPKKAAVDLNALVRESTRIIGPEAVQSGIRVELTLAPDLPPVTCDSIQIEQVLLNLLLNGVEAVQTSGNGERSLTITTAAAGATGIEVAIRDSGGGVPDPPADVFKPFFSTKPNGLGMGLSISRSIIEAHGGRLWATRNADHGSTFRFTLPLERAPAA
jgi:C4-dicarboxylate-specific signal transduction histidine kinase